MKKNHVFFVLIVCAFTVLTGCIDVVHHVGKNKRGITEVYWKVSIQKLVFEMAGEMSGDEMDYEDIFGITENDMPDFLPDFVPFEFKEINNDFDFGFSLKFSAPEKLVSTLTEDNSEPLPFFPYKKDNGYSIILPPGEGIEEDEYTMAFLSSSLYELIISKSLLPRVQEVIFKASGEEYYPEIAETTDVYIVKIPFILWYMSESECEILIR